MHVRKKLTLALWLLALAAAGVAPAQHGAHDPACDRNCLTDLVDAYLDAVVAGDPAAAPIAAGAPFVENTKRNPASARSARSAAPPSSTRAS